MAKNTGEQSEPIQILFCCNSSYFQHLSVALTSLLTNNPHYEFSINLVCSDFDPPSYEKFEKTLEKFSNYSLHLSKFDLTAYSHFFVSGHISLDTYLRIFCPIILSPSINKILYLDVDILVVGDIGDLWNTDIGHNAIGAVIDPWRQADRKMLGIPAEKPYVNCGVMLLNLAEWRENNYMQMLISYIEDRESKLSFHDQDAINAVLFDRIKVLDYKWNFSVWVLKNYWLGQHPDLDIVRKTSSDAAIIHFTSKDKPWNFEAVVPYKKLYFYYLNQTEWRDYNSFNGDWRKVVNYLVNLFLDAVGINYQAVRGITGPALRHAFKKRLQRTLVSHKRA